MSTQNILVSQFWRNNENSFKGVFMAFQSVPDVIKYKIGSEKDPPEGGPFFFWRVNYTIKCNTLGG